MEVIILIMWCATLSNSYIVKDGVVFDKVSDFYTGRSFWKLTLVEELTGYTPELSKVDQQLSELTNHFKTVRAQLGPNSFWKKSFDNYWTEYKEIRNHLDDLNMEFQQLRALEFSHQGRGKRSLLPFVGSLTSFLFGTVSEDDLLSIKRNLGALAKNSRN